MTGSNILGLRTVFFRFEDELGFNTPLQKRKQSLAAREKSLAPLVARGESANQHQRTASKASTKTKSSTASSTPSKPKS